MPESKDQLSKISVALHWLVALPMTGLIGVGIYMAENEAYDLYPTHKSIGILLLLLVVPRLIWRYKNGLPKHLDEDSPKLNKLATAVHLILIFSTLLMPMSGFIMSTAGGHGAAVFGFELVAHNPDPTNAHKVIALYPTLAGIAHTIHHWLGWAIAITLALHIAGALKHHIINKDGTLRRMLGQNIAKG